MEKLRKEYGKTQRLVETDHAQLTHERVKKLLNYANKHFDQAVNNAEYQNLDELDFYKEKFTQVNLIFESGYEPRKHEAELQAAFRQNFVPQGQDPGHQETPQGLPPPLQTQPQPPLSSIPEESMERSGQRGHRKMEGGGGAMGRSSSKDMLDNFFEGKRSEIQKSQLGFKSVLNSVPPAPKKFPVKASVLKSGLSPPPQQQSQLRSSGVGNEEADRLKGEVQELKKRLEEKETEREFNQGLLEVEKRDYKDAIRSLTEKVEHLQTENDRLKEESASQNSQRNQNAPPPEFKQPPPPALPVARSEVELSSQYGMTYKPNNMAMIKSRNLAMQRGEPDPAPRTYDPYARPEDREEARSQRSKGYSHQPENREPNYPLDLPNDLGDSFQREENRSDRSFGNPRKLADEPLKYGSRQPSVGAISSNLRFGQSEIADEAKNIAIRSKLSFFRKSLVLYRGSELEIAVRSSDLIHFETRKISFYVNNKDRYEREADIRYRFDPDYYSVKITKELKSVPGAGQGREDIEVTLKNKDDLDNMIEATLVYGKREFNFLVPAMFVAFSDSRPPLKDLEQYQRQRIEPIYQFANVYSAEEVLPLDMDFEGRQEVGRTFGVSKHHEGYLTLRWVRGKVEIETIRPWKLFLSYLLFKDY